VVGAGGLSKWFLAGLRVRSYFKIVKTATVQQVPQQWPDILKWVKSGEEVQMTDDDKVVAKLVPAESPQPDFLGRAKAIWGEDPPGKSLSAIVSDARGGET
jgi:antitoxin (DNA-binding transcriptional repressor) of toxin-antitoxin stability system